MANKTNNSYNDASIGVLEGLEGIRVRPDMYVGVNPTMHIIKEVLDNSVDEVLNGFADSIWVNLDTKTNTITIKDNGRGMPNGIHPKYNKPSIEILFTSLHAGAKFNKDSFKVSGGKFGIGIKTTNALSKHLEVISERDGKKVRMLFSKGKAVSGLEELGVSKNHGTTVTFIPDESVLKEPIINKEELIETCKMRAYLNSGLSINLKIDNEITNFKFDDGLVQYISDQIKEPLFSMTPIKINGQDENGNIYDVVLSYRNSPDENIISYTNSVINSKGTHETGFKTGLTSFFNDYIKNNNLLNKRDKNLEIKGDDIRKGLLCIISLKYKDTPIFTGQTKDELGNKEVIPRIRKIVYDSLTGWSKNKENEKLLKKICNRIVSFARSAETIRKAQEKISSINSGSSGLCYSASFKDCSSRDTRYNEVIAIEG